MVDPVKAFDTAVKDVVLLASGMATSMNDVRVLSKRLADVGNHIETNYKELQKHLTTMVEAGERLKTTNGLKPDVAAELIKTFYSQVKAAEAQGNVSLVIPELIPEAVAVADPDLPDDGPDDDEPSKWANWFQYKDHGLDFACTNCDGEYDPTEVGWMDENENGFCSFGCFGDYQSLSYHPYSFNKHFHPAFEDVCKISMPKLSALQLQDRSTYVKGQQNTWLNVAKGTGVYNPERVFNEHSIVTCNGCKINFNAMEKGWISTQPSGKWYCTRSCHLKNNGDHVVKVPYWPQLGISGEDWDPGYASQVVAESWLEYVLKHKVLSSFPVQQLAAS